MELRSGYKKTEIGVIPEDWQVDKLAEDIELHSGHHVLAAHCNLVSGFPYLTGPADFPNGHIISTKFTTKPGTICEANDILVTVKGSGAGTLVVADKKYCISRQLMAIRPTEWDGRFLFYSLQQNASVISSAATGLIPGLSRTDILDQRIPVPCVYEQVAIAEALSDVDASIAALSRLIAKKRDLQQGAMQRLLTGQTRLPGFKAPWQEKRLGDLVDTDPENLGADTSPNLRFNYIALEDVDRGRLKSWTGQQFISAPSRARRRLRDRDVLFATVRPNLQAHLLFNEETEKGSWVCSTGFCVLRCRSGVADPAFIFAQLFGPIIPAQIEKLIAGSNYPAVNSGDIRGLWIGAPEPDEQAAVARVLSDVDEEIAALDARLDKTRSLKQAMMQALLTGRVRLPVKRDASAQTQEAAHA